MIKPDTLWSFLKQSEDGSELSVGRVCRALAGHEVDPPLCSTERTFLRMIEDANDWLDEAMEKGRERKKAYRERKAKENGTGRGQEERPGDKPNVPGTSEMSQGQDRTGRGQNGRDVLPSFLPSSLPSSLPSVRESAQIAGAPARVREASADAVAAAPAAPPAPAPAAVREDRRDLPTLQAVVEAAKSVMGVGEGYARWWYREMEARNWTNTDGSRVSTRNWRPLLKSWWNRARADEREAAEREMRKAEAARPRAWAEADWGLCAERCARWRDGRCAGGCITPPDRRPRPIPPEECQHYAAKSGAASP